MSLELGQVLNNRYRIASQIGKSATGVIYRAWDLNLNSACLVKEIMDAATDTASQFPLEAQILQNLNHPGLQKVSDYFEIPEQGRYLVLEFIDGQPLDVIQQQNNGIINEQDAVRWIAQVSETLEYLHTQNPPVIHRDIRPQNIVINKQGNAILVNLGKLGISDGKQSLHKSADAITPGFSSPEQFMNTGTDERSDIYSLGATLYSLLTGLTPPDSMLRLEKDTLIPVQTVNPSIRFGIGKAIENALSLNSSDRFRKVKAFRNALTSAAAIQQPAAAVSARELPTVQTVSPNIPQGNLPLPTASAKPANRKWLGWVIGGGLVGLVIIACLIFGVLSLRDGLPSFLSFKPTATEERREKKKTKETEEINATERAVEEPRIATEAPVIVVTEAPITSGRVEIWHMYSGTAAEGMTEIIDAFKRNFPGITVEELYVPYSDFQTKFETAMAAGAGPTLIIRNADQGPANYDEFLIQDISSYITPGLLYSLNDTAVESVQYKNAVLGLPTNLLGVLLYRNPSIIPSAPQNWDDMVGKAMNATSGDTIGMYLETGFYFSAGHLYGLGGQLLNPNTGEPTFNDSVGVEWLTRLKAAQDVGIPVSNYSDEDVNGFEAGNVGMIIDGTWNVSRFASALGTDNLVIDPWPTDMSGFVMSDMVSLTTQTQGEDAYASLEFMKFMVSTEAQTIWATVACADHDISSGVPVLKSIIVSDPIIAMAMDAFRSGIGLPTSPQMTLYWTPMQDAIYAVMDGSLTPSEALQTAYDQIIVQMP